MADFTTISPKKEMRMRTKRIHKKEEYLEIVSIWPIFAWRQCINCVYEFRRMRGWGKIVGPYWGPHAGNWKYVCSDCASDIKAAATYYDEYTNPGLSNPPTVADEI